jgi:hypothetical protein
METKHLGMPGRFPMMKTQDIAPSMTQSKPSIKIQVVKGALANGKLPA